MIPDAAPGQIVIAASLGRGEQGGAAIACACTHVSHACYLCRHAKEEAEKKEREERQKRQEELRQKRKVALAHCKCLSSFTTLGCSCCGQEPCVCTCMPIIKCEQHLAQSSWSKWSKGRFS